MAGCHCEFRGMVVHPRTSSGWAGYSPALTVRVCLPAQGKDSTVPMVQPPFLTPRPVLGSFPANAVGFRVLSPV